MDELLKTVVLSMLSESWARTMVTSPPLVVAPEDDPPPEPELLLEPQALMPVTAAATAATTTRDWRKGASGWRGGRAGSERRAERRR